MRDPKEFRERFQRWKNGENYWEQRGINMNTQQSQDQQADLLTPEQLTAIEAALEYYTSGKDAVDDVPPERVGIFDPETTHIQSFETGNQVPKRGYIVDNTGTMYAVDNRGQQYNSVLPEVEVVGDRSKFSQKLENLDQKNVQPADNVFVQNNLNSKTPNPEQIYLNRYNGVDGMSDLENGIFEVMQWTPFVGDAIDLLQGTSDLIDGNYLSAGFTGGLLFVPYGNKIRNGIRNIKLAQPYLQMAARNKLIKNKNSIVDKIIGLKPGVVNHGYPSAVNNILQNSISPRMRAARPWLSEEEFQKSFKQSVGEGYVLHDPSTFEMAFGSNSIGGAAIPNGPIVINSNDKDLLGTLLHEIRHKIDEGLPLTEEETNILKRAYGDSFLNLPKTDKYMISSGFTEDYDMWPDAITTNRDARSKLLGGDEHVLDLDAQNKIIDDASDEDIVKAIAESNGYGRAFVKSYTGRIGTHPSIIQKIPKEQIQAWKTAMKYVGAIAAPMGVVGLGARIALDQKNTYNRGKDKGIHINPKNRGKFNALKKRTGKTTEQLTHSKNPLTRKRAIFAQNAKKWKKK